MCKDVWVKGKKPQWSGGDKIRYPVQAYFTNIYLGNTADNIVM